MKPLVIQIIGKRYSYIQQRSIEREEIINSCKNGQHKKQGKENEQHRWEQNDFKIVHIVAVHVFVCKKMMML